MRILYIDTDRMLARNVCQALIRAGHEVVCLTDLQAAVSWADQNTPELVILDLMLAGHSGVEFLYEFRSYPEWANVPVIVYSGVRSDELEDCAQTLDHMGLSAAFYKPATSLFELTAAVDRAAAMLPA